ncbi:MAG: DUF309 domain-containing protein [Chloroflexota bacterium]
MTDNQPSTSPLIVAFVGDLMFTTKIDAVARHLGYRIEWVERADDIGEVDADAPQETPGEMLHGREGLLFRKITEWQPALLVFDLTNREIPWEKWVPMLKASPATRRFPILCFGPHVDTKVIQRARSLGADAVMARSRFSADMPALFEQYARVPDEAALLESCQDPLSPLALEGIELFNRGEYYRCHDKLEEAWKIDQSAGRVLYQGILQVGIAYYQIERGNYRGSVKMLLRLRQWLDPLPPVCRGVNVEALRADVERVYEALVALGPEQIEDFDRSLFQPVILVN